MLREGPTVVQLPCAHYRRLKARVVSGGVAVLGIPEIGDPVLIYCGAGDVTLRFAGAYRALSFEPMGKGRYFVSIPELRADDPGWINDGSFTDLDPKPFGSISPEVQAIMDKMNRNAIIREQAMLRALGNRPGVR